MIDYALWLGTITLVQLSLTYLWFDSQLFAPLFQRCLRYKVNNPSGWKWFLFTLLTCPQCMSYWLSWISAILCSCLPYSSVLHNTSWLKFCLIIFVTGLASSILSRLIDGFMPEPVHQKLFVLDTSEQNPEQRDE